MRGFEAGFFGGFVFVLVFFFETACLLDPNHNSVDTTSGQACLNDFITVSYSDPLDNLFWLCHASWECFPWMCLPSPFLTDRIFCLTQVCLRFPLQKAHFQIIFSAWDFEIILFLYYSESSEDLLFYSYKYRWLFLWSSAILFPSGVSVNYLGFSFEAFFKCDKHCSIFAVQILK